MTIQEVIDQRAFEYYQRTQPEWLAVLGMLRLVGQTPASLEQAVQEAGLACTGYALRCAARHLFRSRRALDQPAGPLLASRSPHRT